jgi:hypothetical protein
MEAGEFIDQIGDIMENRDPKSVVIRGVDGDYQVANLEYDADTNTIIIEQGVNVDA